MKTTMQVPYSLSEHPDSRHKHSFSVFILFCPLPFVMKSFESALVCCNIQWKYSEISNVCSNTSPALLPFAQCNLQLFAFHSSLQPDWYQ